MLKIHFSIFCLFLVALFFQSCNEYKKTEGGLKYKIVVDSAGKPGQEGYVAKVFFEVRTSKDSVIGSNFGKEPEEVQIPKNQKKGSIIEAFYLLSQGDSGVFLINADSAFAGSPGPMPPNIEKGSDIKYIIKVKKMSTKEDAEKEYMERRKQQEMEFNKIKETDSLTINNYLKENNITAQKTKYGTYYQITSPGKGKKLQMGDSVNVMYRGTLLDGTEFDSNMKPGGQPFPVVVGVSQVINGWHDGLSNLSKGDKATLFIPSFLAYGPPGSGPIPPNAPLIFYIEILNR